MKIGDITAAIEQFAPLRLQESYDNSGLQVGDLEVEATGALVCVDVTEEIVDEAKAKGYNLIITHHPLLFRGLKCVAGRTRPERVLAAAIKAGITIYSAHTSADSALEGVSWRMARNLGLTHISTLAPVNADGEGLGAVGNLSEPISTVQLISRVKKAFGNEVLRLSAAPFAMDDKAISRVALCGGAGGDMVEAAIAAGAQAYITADIRHNLFLDYCHRILIIDAGHFETEQCTKQIFFDVISEKFPNFALSKSEIEKNPITYA